MRRIFLLLAFIIFFPQLSNASQDSLPKLKIIDNNIDRDLCGDAFKIAQAQFFSNNFFIYRITDFPNALESSPILIASGDDISGGNALKEKSYILEKISKNNKDSNYPRSIYWQKEPTHNLRFVVDENAFGWRGDQYTLFVIDSSIRPSEFISNTKKDFTPIVEDSWNPPQLMYQKNSGRIWAFSVGEPYVILSDWDIYSINTDGAKKRCSIAFQPNAKNIASLLPTSVKNLAKFLDETLGRGKNEGTLHPTTRIRLDVMHTWANVALRPWSLSNRVAYNSREQVDQELKKWSHKAKSFNQLYRSIYKLYPKAENDLASYYKREFGKSDEEAKVLAKEVLDKAFRMHFVFSK